MSSFELKKFPDRVLRQKCVPLERVTPEDTKILNEMSLFMRWYKGIGLAAPQVGVLRRLIVAEVGREIVKMANPEIVQKKGADKMTEGCLSLPGVEVDVERPYEIMVKGLNEKGETIEFKTKGLLAKVIQHEVDHLNGKLIVDYLNFLERMKFYMKTRVEGEVKDGSKNTF